MARKPGPARKQPVKRSPAKPVVPVAPAPQVAEETAAKPEAVALETAEIVEAEPEPVAAVIHAVPEEDEPAPPEERGFPLHQRLADLMRDRARSVSLDGVHLSGVLMALGDLRHKAKTALDESQDDVVRAVMTEIMDL